MNFNVAIDSLLVLAFLGANLPFLSERCFALIPLSTPRKPFWLRLLEWLFLYALLGLFAYVLESRLGRVQTQHWEFYVITGCAFLIMAYPGFVFCYLRKNRLEAK